MDMILKIAGAIFLGLLGLVTVIGGILFVVIRRCKKSFSEQEMAVPESVTLCKDDEADWTKDAEVQVMCDELASLGFVLCDIYSIEEISAVSLISFVHEDNRTSACLYKHDSIGLFIDLCAMTSDGTELNVSSSPACGELESRPGIIKVDMKGSTINDMFSELKKLISGLNLAEITAESFVVEFEKSYRLDMEWRNARGGTSEHEIRTMLKKGQPNLSEEDVQKNIQHVKLSEIQKWEYMCLEMFEETTDLTVKKWRQYEDEMIIFNESFHALAFLEYLEDYTDVSDRYFDLAGDHTLKEVFETILLEDQSRFEKLGSVERPISVDIYGISS